MTENTFLFPTSEAFSTILIIGNVPNSTCDYYIASRLGESARKKIAYHNPFTQSLTDAALNPNGALIIINRYVSHSLVQWLKQNRHLLAGIIWVVDDDFSAMVSSFNIPLYNKIRPTQTLIHQRALKGLVDHIIVSTNRLAAHFRGWPVTVCPPTTQIVQDARIVDPHQLYYFAKMHKSEHAFLYPIISSILSSYPQVFFTVIAKGAIAKKWQQLGSRVIIKPEMSYVKYTHFIETLPAGGLFLLPLTKSKLNESRSDAKLIDIVKSGSAALIANERPYRNFLRTPQTIEAGISGLNSENRSWINAIHNHLENWEQLNINRDAIKNFLIKRYATRKMIVKS